MLCILVITAALLLAIERISYVLIWRFPERFRQACHNARWPGMREPVEALSRLFLIFKLIQIGVFVAWWTIFDQRFPPLPSAPGWMLLVAAIALCLGQLLNFSVFWRLGKVGVFYGNRLGHQVPWVEGFPFSLIPHPQYVGTLISIWAVFLIMRYPHPDWFILPLIETVFYLLAMRFERLPPVTDSSAACHVNERSTD